MIIIYITLVFYLGDTIFINLVCLVSFIFPNTSIPFFVSILYDYFFQSQLLKIIIKRKIKNKKVEVVKNFVRRKGCNCTLTHSSNVMPERKINLMLVMGNNWLSMLIIRMSKKGKFSSEEV